MTFFSLRRPLSLLVLISALAACAGDPSALDEAIGETGVEGPLREELPANERAVNDGKTDVIGPSGPRAGANRSAEVWSVTRAWSDVENEAGMAWEADAGLNWEQKFDAWVASMEQVPRESGSGNTFEVPTPFGDRTFPAPTLECAEVALLLRTAFASWYNLPFFMQGWDSAGRQSLFAGHFGVINRDGAIVGSFPAFRDRYRDYTGTWNPGDAWPEDARLRSYRLGNDDEIEFLSTDGNVVGAGAYFDELFLNKRAGYFARLLLLYFGSVNLVDEANMYHIEAGATRAGDVLVKRWQRNGIGHVIPVMRHTIPAPDRLELAVASGSMPRRQPTWEDPARAKSSFTDERTGGMGSSYSGEVYAELGGGIRRWRTAQLRSGRWVNMVPEWDRAFYIAPTDLEAIAARPETFDTILAEVSPEEQIQVAVDQVQAGRDHLRQYPASCAARTRREEAFERLYELLEEHQGLTRAEADAAYRFTEDYVFAELVYQESRTCCWNQSTAAMAEIVLDFASEEQAQNIADGVCAAPTVFRARADGYALWQNHAASLGRSAEWNAWSEDESCSQRDVPEDTEETVRNVTDFCESDVDEGPTDPDPVDPADSCDALGQDDSLASALELTGELSGQICAEDEDFYVVEGGGTVILDFVHSDGDLDLEALSTNGTQLGLSTSTTNEERVSHDSTFVVRVYGWQDAAGAYSIRVE